jgi:hypothetical protein
MRSDPITRIKSVLRVRRAGPSGQQFDADMEPEFREIFRRCQPYTMTSVQRMYALYQSVRYAIGAGIPGAFVECGVWRGGSSMLAALTLRAAGDESRELWLYDTFEGMPEPAAVDVDYRKVPARGEWQRRATSDRNDWAYASLEEVEANMRSTGYPTANMKLVKGKVEERLPATAPAEIAILRLDTDWFESTLHELRHLYPRLAAGGVLIIDDYGWWQGAKQATDQFLAESGVALLLTKIDFTGRLAIKTSGRAGEDVELVSRPLD